MNTPVRAATLLILVACVTGGVTPAAQLAAAHARGATARVAVAHQPGVSSTAEGAPTRAAQATPASTPSSAPLTTLTPASTPSHTVRPTPTSAPAPTTGITRAPAPPSTGFVTVCGTELCVGGQHFAERGATAYGQYGNAAGEVALATQLHINTLELVEFDTQYHTLADTESSATWNRVDAFIAAARAGGLHVILNLSEYGQSLQAAGQGPTTTDWGPYLSFVANRVNTVDGLQYASDPTIAMVELWGEIPAPDNTNPVGTTQQVTDFYGRSLAEWKALAPDILASSGGFSYLNEYNAGGIDWKTIMADPNNASCDAEVNSSGDLSVTVAMVSSYCRAIGKPWFLAAWSSCYAASQGSWDVDHWPSDAAMAIHAIAMISVAAGLTRAAMPAMGNDFWNLADRAVTWGSCDIGTQFPLTFAAVA